MKRVSFVCVFLFVFLFHCFPVAQAKDVSIEKAVKKNPVVIVGVIDAVEVGDSESTDIGLIGVSKVLKNELKDYAIKKGDIVPLTMPSAESTDNNPKTIRFDEGTEGLWILKYKDGAFFASSPQNFQPMEKIDEIMGLLESLEGE